MRCIRPSFVINKSVDVYIIGRFQVQKMEQGWRGGGDGWRPEQPKTISCIKKYRVETPEGWVLKQAKKLYRFNGQQRKYLEAKFKLVRRAA